MPIHLLTGRPGHGKTSKMMEMLLEAIKRNDRPVYAAGIEGLTPGLCEILEDPSTWCRQEPIEGSFDADGKQRFRYVSNLPSGALVFVDEAWKWFGHLHSAIGKPTPPHVLALAEHRHFGLDFVWTAQSPGQIYPFVRGLIEQHWHFVRRWGTRVVDVYKWDDLQDDVKSKAAREASNHVTTTLSTVGWGYYKSATQHTVKARIPWKVWLAPVAVVLAVALGTIAYRGLTPDAMVAKLTGQGAEAGLPAAAPEVDVRAPRPAAAGLPPDNGLRDYLWARTMRAPGLHGSQPLFDGREVQAQPRTLCVMSGPPEDQTCSCYTEQVTKLFDVHADVCRHVARWGEYDPFLPPVGSQTPSGEAARPLKDDIERDSSGV